VIKKIINLFPRPLLIKISLLIRPILVWFYKGNQYIDPIDGKSFRKFLPYGYVNIRENVLSPSTLSLERHRLLWLFLQNETDFFAENSKNLPFNIRQNNQPLKVLHFAPEQAFFKTFKNQKNIVYTTTDLNSPLADVKADICHLPFEDHSFDVIFCNHVLEHIPDDTKAMQELYRILAPQGMGVFQIPQDLNRETTFEDNTITDKKTRTEIFGQYDHVRIYGRDYFNKLRQIGFEVFEVDYTSNFSDDLIKKYALAKGEIIPVVRKF
jgi:SAM-dependent methyltransferase